MVCCAVTYFVSVSLCPPVFRLREKNGNNALATSILRREPSGMVIPVCQRSRVYSLTSPGFNNCGADIDLRKRALILPMPSGKILPSLSTSDMLMNQSVSCADEAAYSTADIGPAKVRGLVRGSVTYTRIS